MSNKIPTKLVLGILGIVVLLGGLYVFVFSGDSDEFDSSLQVASSTAMGGMADGTDADTVVDTDQVLRQLNELRRLTISTDMFNSQTFLSLVDFGVTINPQDVGRDNPFTPPTYVPQGASIVPRSNPAVPSPVNGSQSSGENTEASEPEVETTESTDDSVPDTATSGTGQDEN